MIRDALFLFAGVLLAFLTRVGFRKYQDVKRNIP